MNKSKSFPASWDYLYLSQGKNDKGKPRELRYKVSQAPHFSSVSSCLHLSPGRTTGHWRGWGFRKTEAECAMVPSDVAVLSPFHQAPKSDRNMGQWVCDPEEALWQVQGTQEKVHKACRQWLNDDDAPQSFTNVPVLCECPSLSINTMGRGDTSNSPRLSFTPKHKTQSLFTENKRILCLLYIWVGRLRYVLTSDTFSELHSHSPIFKIRFY